MTQHPIRRRSRPAFSLIEMITAMVAATVLMSALAASIVISTNLLEAPPSEEDLWQQRLIEDRIRNDLRYATSIDETPTYGFDVVRPHPVTGVSETVHYESYMDGLTRQVDSGPVTNLDPDAPTITWNIDGYSAPTYSAAIHQVRVCGTSSASSLVASSSIDVPVPTGLKDGDRVFLCLSAKTPDSLTISQSGWQTLQVLGVSDLRLLAIHRSYDTSWPSTIQITSTPPSAMAVVMVALENVDPSTPVDWTTGRGGLAYASIPSSHPTYAQTTGYNDRQLNLQIYAADESPWGEGSMGMACFADVIQSTAADGLPLLENTIGVVVRNGAAPSLSFTPRLLHQESGYWLCASARVEVSP